MSLSNPWPTLLWSDQRILDVRAQVRCRNRFDVQELVVPSRGWTGGTALAPQCELARAFEPEEPPTFQCEITKEPRFTMAYYDID